MQPILSFGFVFVSVFSIVSNHIWRGSQYSEGIVLTLYNDTVIVAAAKFNVKQLELQDSSTSREQVDNHCI